MEILQRETETESKRAGAGGGEEDGTAGVRGGRAPQN